MDDKQAHKALGFDSVRRWWVLIVPIVSCDICACVGSQTPSAT